MIKSYSKAIRLVQVLTVWVGLISLVLLVLGRIESPLVRLALALSCIGSWCVAWTLVMYRSAVRDEANIREREQMNDWLADGTNTGTSVFERFDETVMTESVAPLYPGDVGTHSQISHIKPHLKRW